MRIARTRGSAATHDPWSLDAGHEPDIWNKYHLVRDPLWAAFGGYQQLTSSGILRLSRYYMSYVFINALNLEELISRILAAAGSVDYLLFSCLAYFVIERFGRRKVMMTSALGCSICWIVISISLNISDTGRGDEYKLGAVAVAFFFAFFACFGMGVLGVPWLYPTEINALEMRTKGASLAMATNWIMVR